MYFSFFVVPDNKKGLIFIRPYLFYHFQLRVSLVFLIDMLHQPVA